MLQYLDPKGKNAKEGNYKKKRWLISICDQVAVNSPN